MIDVIGIICLVSLSFSRFSNIIVITHAIPLHVPPNITHSHTHTNMTTERKREQNSRKKQHEKKNPI